MQEGSPTSRVSRKSFIETSSQVFKTSGSRTGSQDDESLSVVEGRASWKPRRSGIFKEEFVENLPTDDKAVLMTSSQGQLFQVGIFCLCAVMGSLVPVATGFTKESPSHYFDNGTAQWLECNDAVAFCRRKNLQYHPTVQLVMESAFSLSIGLTMTWTLSGKEGMNAAFRPSRLVTTAPIAILYAIGDVVQLIVIGKTNAAFFIVVSQLKLLGTALMTLIVFRRNQNLVQWLVLITITMTCILYCDNEARNKGSSLFNSEDNIIGVGLVLALFKAVIGCVCGVLVERAFKAAPDEAIWVNQVQLKIVSVPFAIVMMVLKGMIFCPERSSNGDVVRECIQDTGLFFNVSWKVIVLVLLQACQNFIVGLIYKKVNAIVKYLATAQSLWITYSLNVMQNEVEPAFNMLLLVCLLVTQVITYTMAKSEESKNTQAPVQAPPPPVREIEMGRSLVNVGH